MYSNNVCICTCMYVCVIAAAVLFIGSALSCVAKGADGMVLATERGPAPVSCQGHQVE